MDVQHRSTVRDDSVMCADDCFNFTAASDEDRVIKDIGAELARVERQERRVRKDEKVRICHALFPILGGRGRGRLLFQARNVTGVLDDDPLVLGDGLRARDAEVLRILSGSLCTNVKLRDIDIVEVRPCKKYQRAVNPTRSNKTHQGTRTASCRRHST